MKQKALFIISIVISILVTIHLFIIGFNSDSIIVLAKNSDGSLRTMKKITLMIYISLFVIFALGIIIPNYIKEKKVNTNLLIAYLIFELALNILPYMSI